MELRIAKVRKQKTIYIYNQLSFLKITKTILRFQFYKTIPFYVHIVYALFASYYLVAYFR